MLIQAKNLTKEFNDGEKTFKALDSFSYDFPNSGFYFIVGNQDLGKAHFYLCWADWPSPRVERLKKNQELEGTSFSKTRTSSFLCH